MDRVLSPIEAAERLSITRRSLERWRETGEGPPYVRLGPRKTGYRESALIAWIEANTHPHRAAEYISRGRPAVKPQTAAERAAARLAAEREAAEQRRAAFAPPPAEQPAPRRGKAA